MGLIFFFKQHFFHSPVIPRYRVTGTQSINTGQGKELQSLHAPREQKKTQPYPRGIAPDFCSAPGDQLGLFGDGGDKGFSPSDPLLSCSAPSTSSWLREPSSQPRRGSWQPLNCPSPRELGRKGAITAAHCRANLKQESGCGFKCNGTSSLGAMDRGEENKE